MPLQLLLSQILAQASSAPASDSVKIGSVWDFVVKGGPVMIPIGIVSLVALTVIIERLIVLRRGNVIPTDFLSGLKSALGGGEDRAKALAFCRASTAPVAVVFEAGVKGLGEPVELLERHIQEAGQRVVLLLRKRLRVLSLISSVATLMGLLGTILGLIEAFQAVAASGEALGKTEILAKGIYEAMITTAAGLIVAIPVVIAYHWLAAKIEGLVLTIDKMTVDFVDQFGKTARSDGAARIDVRPAA